MESSMESPVEQPSEKEPERSRHDKSKKKKRKSSSSQSPSHDRKESKRRRSLECRQCAKAAAVAAARTTETIVNKCKLTAAHLTIDQLRVLMAIGGLFYAGRLSAVQAPDVYAITLDGERGNRPHIHSREEILRDAVIIDDNRRKMMYVKWRATLHLTYTEPKRHSFTHPCIYPCTHSFTKFAFITWKIYS